MIPALQKSSWCDDGAAELLLPAAALHAAAAPLEHLLGCEVTQEEAGVWVESICGHAGALLVMRACVVTQFGRDERPLLATIAAHARLHLMCISEVAAALSRVAYSVHSTLIAEQLRLVAAAAAAHGGMCGWLHLLEWFQESLQPDAEELLHTALAALAANPQFVQAFRSDEGRGLRERVRRIAGHVADRAEGNACRGVIAQLYGDDDGWGAGGEGGRHADWPIETAASEEQRTAERAIVARLRALEQVRGGWGGEVQGLVTGFAGTSTFGR